MTVWIGDISWSVKHGVQVAKHPILKNLERIECRDAILNDDGNEAAWPQVDAIIGNPPFLGNKKMLAELGDDYTKRLRACYDNRLSGGVDLVMYWFEKARAAIAEGKAAQAGLVATNSARGGANRKVLERLMESQAIFDAWSDEPWVNEGAAVRVSLICFGRPSPAIRLDGRPVKRIHADLTAVELSGGGSDLTLVHRLRENAGTAFQGPVLVGPFDVAGDQARDWLRQPNPNGRPNSDVLRPFINGKDITSRSRGMWVIDFGARSEIESALYEQPFDFVLRNVKPLRDANRDVSRKTRWWLHGRAGTDWRSVTVGLPRYIATTRVAKHRTFVWCETAYWPSDAVVGIARADDVTFGVLHSRFHEVWSLRLCTWLGVGNDPRYTPTTTFETFPFPVDLTPDTKPEAYINPHAAVIAAAAAELNTLREAWLNPPEWVDRVPEVVAGYPNRIVPKPGHEAALKKRAQTNLYNAKPAWLVNAHRALDDAVAKAYGWADYTPEMSDEEISRRLLALNLERSKAGK